MTKQDSVTAFNEFIAALTADELACVLAHLRRHTARGPFTPGEFTRLAGLTYPVRKVGAAEAELLHAHAEAYAARDKAHAAYADALRDLRQAEGAPGVEDAEGFVRRTPQQGAEVERLAAVVEACRDEYDAAALAELEARPHRTAAQRRRAGVRYPLIGRIIGRGA